MAKQREVECWLVLSARFGVQSWNRDSIYSITATKIRKSKPSSLRSNEAAIKVTLSIPEEVFTRPALAAHIDVPPGAALTGEVVATVSDLGESDRVPVRDDDQ